jgi:hypothetical protein
MNSRIEFHRVRSRNEWARVIRVRIGPSKQSIWIDADWFSTRWELASAAWREISAYCEGLVIRANGLHVAELQRFLSRVLNEPASWLRWDRSTRLEAAA